VTEIWKAVPGFEGLYEVSDHGRVRSLRKDKILAGTRMPNGYITHHLYEHGILTVKSEHELVLLAFVGPRPPGAEVCHNDGSRDRNHLGNLRYDTPKGNSADKKRHGTHRFGDTAAYRKVSEADIPAIRASRHIPQRVLADRYGCTYSNISAIQRGKSWRHVK